MGISTIQSYRGAQIFEALGLNEAVIDHYFRGTASRIGVSAWTALRRRTDSAYTSLPGSANDESTLDVGGEYQWRKEGEIHLFSPQTIHACIRPCASRFRFVQKYSVLVDEQSREIFTLRVY